MKRVFLLTIVFLFIISLINVANADQLKMDDKVDFDFTICDIKKDLDQNYYYLGSNELKKYDKNNNLIYSKDLPNYNCNALTLDDEKNAYIIAISNDTIFLDPENNITRNNISNSINNTHIIKLDSDGNILFDINLDNGKNISIFSGIEVYNNYLYIIGNRVLFKNFIRTEGDGNYYSYEIKSHMLKMDLSGNIIKEISLGDRTAETEYRFFNDTTHHGGTASATILKKDTTILFKDDKIYTYKSVNGEIFLGVYSTNLDIIEVEEFGVNSGINDIVENYDGNYLAVGKIDISLLDPEQPSQRCPCIISYSADGNITSYKTIEGERRFYIFKI